MLSQSAVVLAFWKSPEIYHTVMAEIVQFANKLSEDQFGHHVVRYLLPDGSPIKQSITVC
jgi:hypothetical protein